MKYLLPLLCLFANSLLYSQSPNWQELAATTSDAAFSKLLASQAYGLSSNPYLEEIATWERENISGAAIFQKIQSWDKYPKPNKTGVIIKQEVQLDSTYSAPFYIYLPTSYDPSIPTKLLIYYKGGWISRDELPDNVDKEIVIDNPTFPYLEEYNVIQVFPALSRKLAIFGFYGYKHLRKMLTQTKKLLNIDDNRVYLAGFSDGGRTVYNIAFLRPDDFAAFFPINGVFNNSRMNYPNFANRKITSFLGLQDNLIFPSFAFSVAETAQSFGADWGIHTYDGPHFYYPFEKEIMPILFGQLENTTRNPFPSQIIYHKDYEFNEFTGMDWLNVVVDEQGTPTKHHYSKQVIIETTPTERDTIDYGTTSAQIEANYFNNTFNLTTSLVKAVDIYISPLMVDLNRPVRILVNGKEMFNDIVTYDKAFLIRQFKGHFDRKQVWVNKITIALD
ncbi:MAG: hypothetical protein AAF798_20220 [Bacteroidota bacterium]